MPFPDMDNLLSEGAAISKTLLSTGIRLPEDLVVDDTFLYPIDGGNDFWDLAPEDPLVEFMRIRDRQKRKQYVKLALEFYNAKHQSDYKSLPQPLCIHPLSGIYSLTEENIHTSFEAASADSTPKYFCSNILVRKMPPDFEMPPVVTFCEIADGINLLGCTMCDLEGASYPPPRPRVEYMDYSNCRIGPPLSDYFHILADGVTLSDKAKHRLKYVLPALKYYNHKNRTDYKLVDALPQCCKIFSITLGVVHCNFIAKKNGHSKNRLFFAEIEKREQASSVTYCRVVTGKTKTACPVCEPTMGKRVIHPMRGYRYDVEPSPPKSRLTGPKLRSSGGGAP